MNLNKKILILSANTFQVPYPVYPIGVSYLATYLKEFLPDYNLKLCDLNFNSQEEILNIIEEFKPAYIAVSIRNIDGVNSYDPVNFIGNYKRIIDAIKSQHHKEYKLLIGGAGFSIFPDVLFNELKPDFAIVGEGESSLVELINALDNDLPVDDVNGLVYLKNGKLAINARNKNATDLNLRFDESLVDFYWQNSGMLNIQTKRGCPFQCVYCTYPLIEGRNVRTLNTDKIVSSVKRMKEEKEIDYIFFTDSVFNMKTSYNIELAKKLIAADLGVKWGAYFYPKGLTEDELKLYKESGLIHIEFGTESISDAVLKSYRKHFTVADILQQSELCNKLDIDYAHFLILAGVGETDATVDETYENSKKMGLSVFFPFVGMRIYPGTALQKIAIDEGIITNDDLLLEPKYYISKDVTMETLKSRAHATGKRWVFPDEDTASITNKMRLKRNKKGPLWEYLLR